MKKGLSKLLWITAGLVFLVRVPVFAGSQTPPGDGSLRFEANAGRTSEIVSFLARAEGQIVYVRDGGISLKLAAEDGNRIERLDLDFLGSTGDSPVLPQNALPGYSNAFSAQQARTHVPAYREVLIKGVWEGVDILVYGSKGHLEYDLCLAPGADLGQIRLGIRGAEDWKIAEHGGVEIRTPGGRRILQHAPVIYQVHKGTKIPVEGGYFRDPSGHLGISVPGYDVEKELIIDPILSWASFFGGSGTDSAAAITVDSQGNSYFCGETLSTDFPLEDPYQDTLSSTEAFVVKMDSSGDLVWSTYLGGHATDHGEAIEVDSSGNVYVAGWTFSADFPISGAAQSSLGGGSDAFITKLPSTGDRLIYSSYFGGAKREQCYGLAVDSSGRATLCGNTESSDLPVHSAFQATHGGSRLDAFFARFNASGSSISFSSYLGGAKDDTAHAAATGSDGALYIAGETSSNDFPVRNAYQAEKPGSYGTGAFVSKFSTSGSMVYSTYLAGGSLDRAYGIDVDSSGRAIVCGKTSSSGFPMVSAYQESKAGQDDAFIARLSSQGSSLQYSSFLGGSDHDSCEGLQLGTDGSWNIVGTTESDDFPLASADQAVFGGVSDAFVTILDPDSNTLKYSSYFGGNDYDDGFGLAMDNGGNIYITGRTKSSDLPVLDAYQAVLNGSEDAFVLRIEGGGVPAANSYVLGPVAHAPGSNNSQWRSDLTLVCPGNATASVVMTVSTGSGTKTKNVTVGAKNTLQWTDVLVSLFGYASGTSVSGSIVITSSETIEIISRTYNAGSTGSFGQFIPGLSTGDGVTGGRSGIIGGIVQNNDFRTNLGAVNLGAGNAQIRVTLFDTHGHQLGSPVSMTLSGHQWKQTSNILDAAGAGDSNLAYAKIEMLTGGGEAWAYASVVDNQSNDPTTIPVSLQ